MMQRSYEARSWDEMLPYLFPHVILLHETIARIGHNGNLLSM